MREIWQRWLLEFKGFDYFANYIENDEDRKQIAKNALEDMRLWSCKDFGTDEAKWRDYFENHWEDCRVHMRQVLDDAEVKKKNALKESEAKE